MARTLTHHSRAVTTALVLTLLLTACGNGNDVPEGRDGLTVIKTRADRGLEHAAARVRAAIDVEPHDAQGYYIEAGYSGTTSLYGYEAQATFRAEQRIDMKKVRTALSDIGLETSSIGDGLKGELTTRASGDDHLVHAELDPARTTLTLISDTSGAEIESRSLSAKERADLREPKPLSLDLD